MNCNVQKKKKSIHMYILIEKWKNQNEETWKNDGLFIAIIEGQLIENLQRDIKNLNRSEKFTNCKIGYIAQSCQKKKIPT